ncbi:MAG: DmsC/YnfH family molybdoenzyme membrane anchor subunit, partial [Verrucomicrobiota bacterium]
QQRNLTAVDRFSQRHESAAQPAQSRYYQDLIPLNAPKSGEQYAFEVDLDACSGCKACVSACHSLNGLDEGESWRDVGALLAKEAEVPSQQTVTTACHHCVDPACANGCPTMAYHKDEETGIVRHLDDQCIGCRYCELKCPYEVPKFNDRLGIVRKCDMCQSRLEVGEAPACVQACPNEAIRIRVVAKEEIVQGATATTNLLPGTVSSDYTQPTTRYKNLRNESVSVPSDEGKFHPAHGHFPLVWMLVLTQMGAGMTIADCVSRWLLPGYTAWQPLALALAVSLAGLAGSVLHLGRPLQAWRAFLGWRTSWLSREIIVFGGWSAALMGYMGAALIGKWPMLTLSIGGAASVAGIIGIFTSVMVYADTRREFWAFPLTLFRFFATALTAGLLLSPLAGLGMVPIAALLAYDASLVLWAPPKFRKQQRLMQGALKNLTFARFVFGIMAMLLLANPLLALGAFLFSELAGRALFFRAVDEPKMPG